MESVTNVLFHEGGISGQRVIDVNVVKGVGPGGGGC